MASCSIDILSCKSQYWQEAQQDQIHDLLIIKLKGHPQMTCLNSQLEGPPQGSSGTQNGAATQVDNKF